LTLWVISHRVPGEGERMSTSFDDFMRDMEAEAYRAGPEAEAAFFESQQRHWIGRRLFERRRELGYTQAKLSALSGINQSDISKIEHAEANPTLDTLAALATALGLTLALEPISEQVRALVVRRKPPEIEDLMIDATAVGRSRPAPAAPRAAADKRSAPIQAGNGTAASPRVIGTPPNKRRRTP
jgi:transcriptional regulator with XRE-family HTH domain